MTEGELFAVRLALVAIFLEENDYDGILLSRWDNFAMATGGKRSYVGTGTDGGASSLFVDQKGKAYFIGNTIEAPRVLEEELVGLPHDALTFLWFEDDAASVVQRELGSGNFVSDDGALGPNVNGELYYLRSLLTPAEMDKYRALGAASANAMMATLRGIEIGMTEWEVAAILTAEGMKNECYVPVALIAADERIAQYRHPLPTIRTSTTKSREVERYVMLVGCFQREGLVASITRFKQVDDLDEGLLDSYARVCGVDALMQEASTPGATLGEVFDVAVKGYETLGFNSEEWHNHHQGGTTGYEARTCKGSPGESFPIIDEKWTRLVKERTGIEVQFGHAFAWNPSAPGVKSEDTFILEGDGKKEIVTATPEIPSVDLASVLGRETSIVKSAMYT